ncbi:MAG TPA: hypothetical protein VGQ39_04865 [Pyrinomonadaceae bacterium]|nr:hypothetical protein [Pyrinomonadaceae bacterium]
MSRKSLTLLCLVVLLTGTVQLAYSQSKENIATAEPVLWRDPGNISELDLRYGPGARHLAPVGPFTFVEEVKSGESPKIAVRDARGVRWTVKLGEEAQAETVATRLVWAIGYFAEEAYYFDRIRVRRLPKLSRGQEFVVRRNVLRGARFEPKRNTMKEGSSWEWNKNPFEGSRELSGLKIMMILLNNYDARTQNNKIFYVTNNETGTTEARHYVTDLGATLGKADGLGGDRSKNNLNDFLSTRFVMGIEDDGSVTFDYDTKPTKLGMLSIVYPPYYRSQVKKERAMRGIPVDHARWVGSLLSQLTDEQLRQPFIVAKYEPRTATAFVNSLRARINQLSSL